MLTKLAIFAGLLPGMVLAADRWDRVAQIAPRAEVRIKTFDGAEHRGPLSGANAEQVRLTEGGQTVSLTRADVERVEVHDGSRKVKRALIGGGIGVAAGIVAGFATCPSCVGETSAEDFHQRLAVGGLIGGGVGAGIGALGSSYKTVYKAKRR